MAIQAQTNIQGGNGLALGSPGPGPAQAWAQAGPFNAPKATELKYKFLGRGAQQTSDTKKNQYAYAWTPNAVFNQLGWPSEAGFAKYGKC